MRRRRVFLASRLRLAVQAAAARWRVGCGSCVVTMNEKEFCGELSHGREDRKSVV